MDPVITTTHGKVRGKQRKTLYDDDFYCFDGIPYARPPLGELRFGSPKTAEPWQGILDCTEVKPKCHQRNRYTQQIEGSEDCLYLNIYAKSLQTTKPLPVIAYVHGGGNAGDASRNAWAPDYFMMKEVVFITIGYRMGAFGFLSLKDPTLKVPGNAGLKDIVLALKWIKANCSFFNGDPQNITICGHSSGSNCVQLLVLSPQSIGLFHKAVLMSGFNVDIHELPNSSYRLAKSIGYDGDENAERAILDFLTCAEKTELLNCDFITAEEKEQGFQLPFLPCVEPYASEDSVLLEHPVSLLQNTWSNKIPLMIGNTSQEFILYKQFTENAKLYELFSTRPERMLPLTLQVQCKSELQKQLAEQLKQIHFGDKAIAFENATCALDAFIYGLTFHPCNRILLSRRAKSDNAPTYLYRFDFYSPDFNFYSIKHLGRNVCGISHADELSYLFRLPQSFKLSSDTDEFKTIVRMVDIWTSFAANSNPNCKCLAGIAWEPLARNKPDKPHMCLNISNELSFIVWPETDKCNMWNNLFEESGLKMF